MEVRIPRDHFHDAMFSHERDGLQIEEQVSRNERILREQLGQNLRMALCRRQHGDRGRGQERLHKGPRLSGGKRLSKYARMRGDAKELKDDTPREVPQLDLRSELMDEPNARVVFRRGPVRGIDEDAGVEKEYVRTYPSRRRVHPCWQY